MDITAQYKVGITSTVPVEAVLAAGLIPVDLNNAFIMAPDRAAMIASAEARGFPLNLCAWIKGVYAAAKALGIRRVIGVTRGDCSSTEKLLEVWDHEGLEAIPFAYPRDPDPAAMGQAIAELARRLSTTKAHAEERRLGLIPLRAMLRELDELSWQEGKVTGSENHLWLVSGSDFNGSPERFAAELKRFLEEARRRNAPRGFIRLGFVGVPPIFDDLYQFLESRGARVVFNETQRQFAMIGESSDLAEQYSAYTYPYPTSWRLADIRREIERRSLRAVIHYAQTFCPRQIEAILMRESLGVPVLTIEADKPGPLDARTMTRIEAFLEQIA
jgi:benzoyl-CoA reductase/2-hydroxyglutaryl-CoA dehydratase subunit BcrC/BadD/HgdB